MNIVLFDVISIHSLRMEGDRKSVHGADVARNFNPLPPHGGRRCWRSDSLEQADFNPLPPHGGRLNRFPEKYRNCVFQSTPSAWRETGMIVNFQSGIFISIHSLRMEGDRPPSEFHVRSVYFNPLPPHGGRPLPEMGNELNLKYFNPLPPHGGRL